MPERKTVKRARKAKKQGKAATSQARIVREEIHHIAKAAWRALR